MGYLAMNLLHHVLVLAATVLAVFCQAAMPGFFHWFGAQINLLPALMVFAGLQSGVLTVSLAAWLGGLCFDALSANPLGISVLPLFLVGLAVEWRRELILRDQLFAQIVLGTLASALVPALTVLMLLSAGKAPLLGWGSCWQLLVMTATGGIATPLVFVTFNWLDRMLGYQPVSETSFRPDREIRRGRN